MLVSLLKKLHTSYHRESNIFIDRSGFRVSYAFWLSARLMLIICLVSHCFAYKCTKWWRLFCLNLPKWIQQAMHLLWHYMAVPSPFPKGQFISKCPLGVIVSTKKNNEIFLRISALASKKRLNQKHYYYKYVK